MAKATKIEPVAPAPTVVLELSMEEARTLHAVTGQIIGTPRTSRRGHTDSIYQVLGQVINRGISLKIEGQLSFEDEPGLVL